MQKTMDLCLLFCPLERPGYSDPSNFFLPVIAQHQYEPYYMDEK